MAIRPQRADNLHRGWQRRTTSRGLQEVIMINSPGPGPGVPPKPRPAAARSRRTIVIIVVALACVPVLWFVFVLALWTLAGGDAPSPAGPGAAGRAGGAPLTQVVFSSDGTLVAVVDASASSDMTRVTVSAAATGKVITTVADPHVDAAAISPDDATLAILEVDGTTYLRDITTGQPTAVLPAPGGAAEQGRTVAFRPDGKLLAVADASSGIYLWNPATRHMTASFTYPGTGNILGLTFSPDGKTLAVFDNNNHTYVLAASTGQPIATLTNSYMSGGPNAVAYSPDSTILAICTADGASLWNIATGGKTATWKTSDGCQAAAFSPDGTTLAIGDSNGRISLRDIATGITGSRLTIAGGVQILDLAFSGGATISAGYLAGDGTTTGIRHWTISPPA
jgi:WD40 repeat protein